MDDLTIAIDHGDLDQKLKDIGEYLAELKYIDLALDHIRERNHHYAGPPAEDGTSPAEGMWHIHFALGTRYPFTSPPVVAPKDVSAEAEQRLLEPLAEAAAQWAADEMRYLNQRVREIMYYPLDGYAPLNGYLERVWSAVNDVETNFGYLDDELADWKGGAATDFKSLFYSKYGDVQKHQQQLVRTLQGALEVSRRSVEYAQQSVINAATSAREALLEQLRLRSTGSGQVSSKEALLAVAVAFTVLELVTSGNPLWKAAFVLGGFAAGQAASEIPAAAAEPRSIDGKSADDLSASVFKAIQDVDAHLIRNLDYLHDDLRRTQAHVWELHKQHLMSPKRPALADGVSGADFYHTSSEQYP